MAEVGARLNADTANELMPPLQPSKRLFVRSHPLQTKTGSDIFAALFQPQMAMPGTAGIATLLESPYPLPPDSLPEQAAQMTRYSICAGAPRVVSGQPQLWTPEIGQVQLLLAAMGQQAPPKISRVPDASSSYESTESTESTESDWPFDLPFTGGWLGWLGYDCAWEIERLPWLKEDTLPFPVAFWYEPAEFAVLDHHRQQIWLAAQTLAELAQLFERLLNCLAGDPFVGDSIDSKRELTSDGSAYSAYLDNATQPINSSQTDNSQTDSSQTDSNKTDSSQTDSSKTYGLTFETTQSEFEQAVLKAKAHIRAGDVFQVNHSLRFQAKTHLHSWQVYKTLHRINPSPFASYWHTPWGSVVSCSPERLVHLKEGVAQSRPIAGTRPRGETVDRDGAIAQVLTGDRKECAEHIMLVDLARNDLGRVCEWGSVQVAELMTVERYSHVMHLVSNVVGKLADKQSAAQLVAALFPGGTITGCPKVRCMEIIEALEPVRRSLFYGSCGYFDRCGQLDLNILIRTLLLSPDLEEPDPEGSDLEGPDSEWQDAAVQTVWGQVGAGIVADSEPEREWRESLQKAKAQLLALGL
ncbi:MAG: Anthranilate/para-aminobenzoate synthases component I [Phormidesmis priestleyi Ana]|uniref:Anthranilate synthase component 1 n=1 Tax=Phormidesmis priestleyi Ana TaxID=1666911 RepID=A0A0P7ZYS4_9CYAN|nr:MAG: Anthranilate/para-aminobenzoate synthases component I [Phormidesmis priestleyi Ana]